MSHIEGVDRNQFVLFPEARDESISEGHPVRFIEAFVACLGLEIIGIRHALSQETWQLP